MGHIFSTIASYLVVGFNEFENFGDSVRVGLNNLIEIVADNKLNCKWRTSESFEKWTTIIWQNSCWRD